MRLFANSTIFTGSHVEDEDLAALGEAARLDDETRGFGDGHEVALDIGMGNRHRAACGDLALEHGDDAAVGTEHVAEANRREHGLRSSGVVLDDHFPKAFGSPHDRRRVHCLIG